MLLLNEDFKSFKIGDFPYEPFLGAMGEYHYRPNQWYDSGWYDPTPIMGSGGTKTWMIMEQDGVKFIEYSTAVKNGLDSLIILANGDFDWNDYTVSCQLRLLLKTGCAGLIFRYQNSLCFYMLCFDNGMLRVLKRDQPEIKVLFEKDYAYSSDRYYHFKN